MAQEALTGYRKYKSPYVSEINARKAYLPALYNQRRDDKYREQSYNLDKQGLAQNKEFALKNLELSEKAAHQARKRDKLAANLGYAGLGLQAGFGLANQFDFSNMFSPEAAVDVPSEMVQAPIQEAFTGGTDYIRDVAGLGAGSIFEGLGGPILDVAGSGFFGEVLDSAIGLF